MFQPHCRKVPLHGFSALQLTVLGRGRGYARWGLKIIPSLDVMQTVFGAVQRAQKKRFQRGPTFGTPSEKHLDPRPREPHKPHPGFSRNFAKSRTRPHEPQERHRSFTGTSPRPPGDFRNRRFKRRNINPGTSWNITKAKGQSARASSGQGVFTCSMHLVRKRPRTQEPNWWGRLVPTRRGQTVRGPRLGTPIGGQTARARGNRCRARHGAGSSE